MPWLTRRWSTTASYVALFVVVVATRVPFLRGTGLGADPDAWRLYLTGRVASATGDYAPSRTPGYPAVELVAFGFGHAPWWAYTGATAVVGGIGAVLVAFLARELRVTWWWLVGFGTAFTGVVFVASTTFMDYLWAFAALAGALAAMLRRKPSTAGVLLGLALACRPSTVFAAVVVVVLLCTEPWWTLRRSVRLIVAAVVTAVLFYAIPLGSYGAGLVSAGGGRVGPGAFARLVTVDLWGWYATGALVLTALVIAIRLILRRREPGQARPSVTFDAARPWTLAMLVSLLVQVGGFFLLPADPAYLIPAVAMVWLLAGMFAPRAVLATLAVVVLVAPLVGGNGGPSPVRDARNRRAEMAKVEADVAAVRRLPADSIVVAGFLLPQVLAIADAVPPARLDTSGKTARIVLRGGQVLVYTAGHAADASSGTMYRLPGVVSAPATLPILPN